MPRGAAALLLAGLLATVPVAAQDDDLVEVDVATEVSDTMLVLKADEQPGNAEISVRLSKATVPDAVGGTVLVGRDDFFADAMASAVLQSSSPLLLVPQEATDSDQWPIIEAELDRGGLGSALLLGGTTAPPPFLQAA